MQGYVAVDGDASRAPQPYVVIDGRLVRVRFPIMPHYDGQFSRGRSAQFLCKYERYFREVPATNTRKTDWHVPEEPTVSDLISAHIKD